ncbi:hypothetical protein [Variovorax guangxiensis]|uniref:hypothetical protein n=1 Tax=Variovorax guangxiensis TaxID=1775474 RepID=UPI002860266C|nr:hypothetical protein [Variovorax guangxiensis]MDR6860500.1 type VI protein secretion system component VasK [Variovorax guangxiensis]
MNSNRQCRYRRLLGWAAASSTILVLGLLSTEFLFPTVPAAPYASSPGAEFQRLLLVIALVVALATFAGAVITTALAWLAKWKEREEDATLAPNGRFGLAAEPANERLRALRAVISRFGREQAREP